MNTEDGYIMDDLGVQGDGEPAVAEEASATPEPADPASPETPEADAPEHDEEAERPHKKPGSVRLKERLAREAQEKEYWRNLALEAQQKAAPEPSAPVIDPSAPRPEDFDDHASWVAALTQHVTQKALAEERQNAQAHQMRSAWEQKAAAVRAEAPDFDEVLEDAPAPSPVVAQALHKSENGARMAYHLAKNPEEYDRINRLDPIEAAMELGRLETRLAASKKPEAHKPAATKAPKPPTPVSSAAATKPADDGRFDLY